MLPNVYPDGLTLRAIVFSESSATFYYAKSEITASENIVQLLADDGAYLSEATTSGRDASLVAKTVGAHATMISVGAYPAAYVVSSPWPAGFYTHGIYWSDGTRDFSLVMNGPGEDAIRVAQSIYC